MSIESDVATTAIKAVASPILHYVYGAIIALLIGGFVTYTIHERNVGKAEIEASDAAHAKIIAAKDQTITDNAQLQLIDVGNHAKILLAAPPVANTGLVCVAPRSATPAGSPQSNSQSGEIEQLPSRSFDPSGAILTLLSDDDIRINSLIDTVEILQGYIEALKVANDNK